MAAIAFDVSKAERRLKTAGASDELAEARADLMSEAVLLNLDALVTKDYLDSRLDQQRAELAGQFRLLHALQALLLAGVFIPQMQNWFSS